MTTNIIKPTIGRRVWYWPSPAELDKTATGNLFPHINDESQALDAGIVYVWNDRLVNLAVTDHQGCSQARTSVRLLQDGESAAPGEAYAQWMPYQAGQARKDATQSAAEKVNAKYDESVARANDCYETSSQRIASAWAAVHRSATISENREPTQRDRLEQALVMGIAMHIGETPSKAEQIADGIKVVLDALHPTGVNAPTDAGNHASAVLYPAIKDAMQCMRDVPEGKNLAVDIAWNILHDAFWSESPAPSSAAPRRAVSTGTMVFADGTIATGALPLPTLSPAEQDLEAEIQAKGLTAPRVTPADLQANILHTEIVKHISPSGQVLRWAVLTTRNGFAVAGRPSASASSANDNAEIGERVAIDNAKQELWPLMGYALRGRLAGQ